MNLKSKIFKNLFGLLMIVSTFIVGLSSCKDDLTTDNTSFALYYTSMTDIGPSMSGVIASPTYKGAAPYDFKITEVTYSFKNEQGEDVSEVYNGECFSINNENGEISINSTADMKTGKYFISVSCYSAGSLYSYKNAVEVNFLKAVPEGIIVEPNFMEAKLADVMKKNSEAKLPTAQVTTENTAEHISITGYKISNVVRIESDDSESFINNNKIGLFSISDKGVISINKSDEYKDDEVKAGLYRIDLKLVTAASPNLGEEEGLFVDAIKVNLSSAPTAIVYEKGCIETGNAEHHVEYSNSSKPLIEGSYKDAIYEIIGIKKSTDDSEVFNEASEEEKSLFSIDSATGIVSVRNTSSFTIGNIFKVSVKVSNPYGEYSGTDVLTLNVVEWVDEMVDFTYETGNMKQGMGFVSSEATYQSNYYVEYSLKSVPAGYEDFFSIDKKTGVVKIEKYNTLPRTDISEGKPVVVEVLAKNFKNEATGKLEINVLENPNYFTYISYGNNLVEDQTPGSIYDNQFRFHRKDEMDGVKLNVRIDAIDTENIKWKIKSQVQISKASINESTGEITLSKDGWKSYQTGYIIVEVTKGTNDIEKFSRLFPIFFNFSEPKSGVVVEYTPFVVRVNPKVGGRSVVPYIENGGEFLIDYRRSFNYYNINGVDSEGNELKSGTLSASNNDILLGHLWESVANSTNYGGKLPVSYYDNSNKPKKVNVLNDETLAYVDNTSGENKYSVVVNPNWYDDGWADGIFTGQMTFVTNNNPSDLGGSKNQIFPIAIWFDKNMSIEK